MMLKQQSDIKRIKKALLMDILLYMETGGVCFIDRQYVAYKNDKTYKVGLIKYEKSFYKNMLGKWQCGYKHVIKWSEMKHYLFIFFLKSAGYFSTNKPNSFDGWIEKPTEAILEGLRKWLYKGLDYLIVNGKDKGFIPWLHWLNYTSYSTIEQAIAEIDESLVGSFFIPIMN